MSTERKKTEQAAAPRRPYERPAVVSDEVFETMALSCAKANRFTCPGGNPQSS
jgi:hypothetical protein